MIYIFSDIYMSSVIHIYIYISLNHYAETPETNSVVNKLHFNNI